MFQAADNLILLIGIFVLGSLFLNAMDKYMLYEDFKEKGCSKSGNIWICQADNQTTCYIWREGDIMECLPNYQTLKTPEAKSNYG